MQLVSRLFLIGFCVQIFVFPLQQTFRTFLHKAIMCFCFCLENVLLSGLFGRIHTFIQTNDLKKHLLTKSNKNIYYQDRVFIYLSVPIHWGTRVHPPFFQDLPAALRRLSDFLERNLSEDVIQKIAQHCSFKAMKDNQMSNFSLVPKELMNSDISPFLRKGELFAFSYSDESSWCYFNDLASEVLSLVLFFGVFLFIFDKSCRVPVVVPGVVGDWKNHFTPEQLQRFTSVLQKELQNENFTLPWSLEWSLFTQSS